MTGPQYPQPQPYGQGPQQPYGQQPPMRPTAPRQPMAEPVRNALIVAGVVVVVSVLIMVTSWLLVGLAILLVGGFYAFLVFRGMPPFANVNQTMDALKSLSGPSRAPTGYAPGHQQPVQHQQPGQQQQ
ncbi:hypothetical protein nbrc107696_18410 [Gordonia spumicola]|uniref:Uncharacterized protein n=1 Tax=Gordonia spumicola TaxID=589161 RepID=A0A7I9V7P1_9ACTN|nr:hypothetical protein [Gordonia spumicola]GEE01395.1 hypothetical protein nbrc107696_18410 [Gordonia spumicola]